MGVTNTESIFGSVRDCHKCTVGEGGQMKTGVAGHVTLSYPSGGQIVTSMGHWIELTHIDTSLEAVMQAAGRNFGAEEVADMMREYRSSTSDAARYECVQKRARSYVQKSVPSKMKSRTKC